ncbi:DUF975 domain-containing protein [Nodularia harveyana UHCC-0300]|uniref:DUF975 domain-containing protein n=1 Tax=Nodularia harveyana UHCC-0300 TaxID=2974287 RepID=A0ABU5UHG2_9CYAN|nr:DUF975 domain-containing protein [Nodularia harveyana]MEA5582919.1 DUF975 domain-containing protein [Nodularia harveyana UHCC-0300]
MAGNMSSPSPQPTKPLDVSKVITAAVRLYRPHIQEYFLLALKALLWLLVPVYGWAKFFALTALISRLAFGELVNQPESIPSGERFVNSRLWQFLFEKLLLLLLFTGVGISLGIIFFLISGLLSPLLIQLNSFVAVAVSVLLISVAVIVISVGFSLTMTRFYLVEVVLAVEENVDSLSAISRTWKLTEGYGWRIWLIYFVWSLITIPVQIAMQVLFEIISVLSRLLTLLPAIAFVAVIFITIALMLPLYQTITAVVYYEIRSRQEGLGLKLRDGEI